MYNWKLGMYYRSKKKLNIGHIACIAGFYSINFMSVSLDCRLILYSGLFRGIYGNLSEIKYKNLSFIGL